MATSVWSPQGRLSHARLRNRSSGVLRSDAKKLESEHEIGPVLSEFPFVESWMLLIRVNLVSGFEPRSFQQQQFDP